mgnify:CR=1 FL=1
MNVNKITLRDWVTGAVIAVLALVPLVVSLTDNAFFLDLATRFVILAIAAGYEFSRVSDSRRDQKQQAYQCEEGARSPQELTVATCEGASSTGACDA